MALTPDHGGEASIFQTTWPEDEFSNFIDFDLTLNDTAISLGTPTHGGEDGQNATAEALPYDDVMQDVYNGSHHHDQPQQQQQQPHHHHIPRQESSGGNALDVGNHATAPTSAPISAPSQSALHHQRHPPPQQQQQQQAKDIGSMSFSYTSHHGHQLVQGQSIPPTPTSAEMHHGLGVTQRYEPQQFISQGAPDEMAAFTPLISPDMTPLEQQFRMMPEYSLPSQYFTPLTSPAIEAMNMPQSMLQSLTQGYDASSIAMGKQSSQDQMYVFQGDHHATTSNQQMTIQNHQHHGNQQFAASGSDASASVMPGQVDTDVSMGNTIVTGTTPSTTAFQHPQGPQQAYPKNRPSMRTTAGVNRVRQSPSILAQKRKVGEPEQQPHTIPEQGEAQNFESLMPPPALPGPSRRTSIVNDISNHGQNIIVPTTSANTAAASASAAAAAAATPATLMKLARRRSSAMSDDTIRNSNHTTPHMQFQQAEEQAAAQPMEDIQLPQQAIPITAPTSYSSTLQHSTSAEQSPSQHSSGSGSHNNSTNISPRTSRALKPQPAATEGASSSSSSTAAKTVKRAGSGNSLRKNGSSASPSIAPKRKQSARSLSVLTPKIAPMPSSGAVTGGAGPSPAIRPKLSPCIPANGGGVGGGTGSGSGSGSGSGVGISAHYDLASKSNYQRILDGTLLPGVSYPETLTENLSSKRKNHKLAEQGRRNRINAALKEMESLIPAEFAHEFSQKKKAKEGKEEDVCGGTATIAAAAAAAESPPSATGSTSTATAKANQVTSKASTVEMAIVYIKALQEELRAVKQQQQQQQQQQNSPEKTEQEEGSSPRED